MTCARSLEGAHVHAFCQPGKHAFLPDGALFRLIPGWRECCNVNAGGGVLVGGPFHGLYEPAPGDDARCLQYIRERFSFEPTLTFDGGAPLPEDMLRPWEALRGWIPGRIAQLCGELR